MPALKAKPSDCRDTVILGAGLAGLACAYHCQGPVHIFEASAGVGGSARSVNRGGFTFDLTGHWLHLRDPSLRAWVQALMGDNLVTIHRRAAVFSHGMHTAYPFQAHTHGLPAQVVADCVLGYFAARERALKQPNMPCTSFDDYIRQCMGDGIAEHFMIPYNQKLWTVHPRELAHTWCGRFVPLPQPDEVVWGALTPAGAGRALGYNQSFLYPRHGGIGQLAHAIAQVLPHPVHLEHRVTRIDWSQRRLHFAQGASAAYGRLVSTLPLNALLCAMHAAQPLPPPIHAAQQALRATQLTWWDIGLARPTPPSAYHWVYYPGAEVPFFRVGCPSAVWPGLAPPGHMSLSVEVAHSPSAPCPADDADIVAGLRRVGLLGEREVPILLARSSMACAYVIMDHAYGSARQAALSWLAEQGIESISRFGAWMYDSMEGALAAGRACAARLNIA